MANTMLGADWSHGLVSVEAVISPPTPRLDAVQSSRAPSGPGLGSSASGVGGRGSHRHGEAQAGSILTNAGPPNQQPHEQGSAPTAAASLAFVLNLAPSSPYAIQTGILPPLALQHATHISITGPAYAPHATPASNYPQPRGADPDSMLSFLARPPHLPTQPGPAHAVAPNSFCDPANTSPLAPQAPTPTAADSPYHTERTLGRALLLLSFNSPASTLSALHKLHAAAAATQGRTALAALQPVPLVARVYAAATDPGVAQRAGEVLLALLGVAGLPLPGDVAASLVIPTAVRHLGAAPPPPAAAAAWPHLAGTAAGGYLGGACGELAGAAASAAAHAVAQQAATSPLAAAGVAAACGGGLNHMSALLRHGGGTAGSGGSGGGLGPPGWGPAVGGSAQPHVCLPPLAAPSPAASASCRLVAAQLLLLLAQPSQAPCSASSSVSLSSAAAAAALGSTAAVTCAAARDRMLSCGVLGALGSALGCMECPPLQLCAVRLLGALVADCTGWPWHWPVVGAGALEGLVGRVVALMALADPEEESNEGQDGCGWSGGCGGGGLHAAAREVVVRLAAGPLLVREALVRSGVLAAVVEAVMLPPAAAVQAPAPAGRVQQQGFVKGRLSAKPSAQQLLPPAPASASAWVHLEAMLSVLLGLSSLPGVRSALAAPGMAPLLGQLLALFETLPAAQRQPGSQSAGPSRAASHSSASSRPGTAAGSGGGGGSSGTTLAPAQTGVHGTVTQLLLNLALDPATHGSLASRHAAELLVRCAALGKGHAGAYSSGSGGSVAAADPAVRAVAALRLMAALAADARYTSHRPAAQRALVAAGAVEYAEDVVAEAVSGLPAGTAVALYDAGLAALCALMAGSRGVQRRVAGCGRLLAALVAALSHPAVLACDRRLRATLTAWRLITAPLVASAAAVESGGGRGGGDSLAATVLGALGVMVGKTSGDGTAAAPLAMPRVSILQGAVAVAAEKAVTPPAPEAEASAAAPRGADLGPGLGRISDESDGAGSAAAATAVEGVWESAQLPGTPLPSPGNAASPPEPTPLRVPSALVRQGLSAGGSRAGTPPGTPSGRRGLAAGGGGSGGGGGGGGSGGSGGGVTPRSTSFARTDSGVSAASTKSVTVPGPTAHTAASAVGGGAVSSASARLRPGSANSSSGGGSPAPKPPLPRSALGQAAAPGQAPKPAAPASAAAEPGGEVQLSTAVTGPGAAAGKSSSGKMGKGAGSMWQKGSEGVAAAGPASPYYPPPAARRNQVVPSPAASAPLPTLPDTVLLVHQPSYAEGVSISAPQDPAAAAGDDAIPPAPAAAAPSNPDAPMQPQADTSAAAAAPATEGATSAPALSAPSGPPHRSNSPATYAPDILLSSVDISFANNTTAAAQANTTIFPSSSGGVGGPAEQLVLQLQSLLLRPATRAPAALVLVQLARGGGVRGSAALAMGWNQLVEAIKGSITSVYSDSTQGQQQQQQQPRWRQEEGQKRGPRGTGGAPGYRPEPVRRGSAGFLAAALDSLSYGAGGPYGDLDEHDVAALLEALEVVAGGCVDGREALARDQPYDSTAATAQYDNVVLSTLHTQYDSDSGSDIDVGYCGRARKSPSKRPGGKRAAEEGPHVTLVEALAELACGWGPLADRLGAGRIAALEAQEQGQQGEEVLVRADTQVAASWRVPAKAGEAVAAAAAGVRSTAAGGGGQACARRVLDTCRAHACRTLAWLVPQPSVRARLDAGGMAAELAQGLLVTLSTTKDDDLRFAAVGLLRQLVSHAGAAHDALAHPACVVTAVEALEAIWHQHGQLISPAAAPRVIARPTTASSYAATARLAMGRPALLRIGSGNPSQHPHQPGSLHPSPLSGHHAPGFPRNASFSSFSNAGPMRSNTQPMPSLSRPSGSGYGFHPPTHTPHGSHSQVPLHPASLLVAHSGPSTHAMRGSKSGAHPTLSGAAAGGVGSSLAGNSPHGVATRLSLASGACSDALRWTDPTQHARRMLEMAEEVGGGGGTGSESAVEGLESGSPRPQQHERTGSAAQPPAAERPVSAASSNTSGGARITGGGGAGGGGGGSCRTPRPSGTGMLEASGRLASVLPPLPAALVEENQLLMEVEAAGRDPLRAAALAAALAAASSSNGGGRKRRTSEPFAMDDLLESAGASREPGHTDSDSDSSEDEEEGRGSLVAAALLAGLRSNSSGGRQGAKAERRGPRTLLPVQAGPAPVIPKTRSNAGASAAGAAGRVADGAASGSPRGAGGPSTPAPVSGSSVGGGGGGGGVTAEAASQCAVRLVEVLTALAVDADAARAMSTLPCFELFVDLATCRSPPLALAALGLLHRLAARQDTHETFWDCDAVAQLVAHVQRRSAAVSAAAATAAAPSDSAAAAVQLRAAQVLERLAADPDLHGRLAATELPAALMAIVKRGAEPPTPQHPQAAALRDAAGVGRMTGASPTASMPTSLDDRSVRGGTGVAATHAATAGAVALARGLSRSSLAPSAAGAGPSSPSFSSPSSSSLLACALSALCSLLDSPDVRRQARERRVPLHLGMLASASASGAAAGGGGGGGGGDPLVAMLAAQCGEKLRADTMPMAGGGRPGLHVSQSAPQLPS